MLSTNSWETIKRNAAMLPAYTLLIGLIGLLGLVAVAAMPCNSASLLAYMLEER